MTEPFSPQSQQPAYVPQASEDINLLALVGVLWRGKLWILAAMIGFAFLGGYYAFRLTEPKFNARSTIVYSPSDSKLLDLENIIGGSSTDTDSLNTEVATIRSRETLEQLVNTLELTKVPEFNPKLLEDPDAFSLVGAIKGLLGWGDGELQLTPEQEEALTLRRTTDNVRAALSVRIERDTYLLNITATSTNPVRAAEMANTLAEIYIKNRHAKTFAATEQAIDWLSERVRQLEQDLHGKEQGINALQSETDLVSREALEQMSLQAKEFRDRLKNRQAALAQVETQLTLVQSAMNRGDYDEIVLILEDPLLRRLLQNQRNSGGDLTDFELRVQALLTTQSAEVGRIEREVDALSASQERLQADINEQSQDLQRLEQMQRELDVTRDLYQTFLTGLQEVSVQVGLVQTDASVMSQALPPLNPVSPNTKRILVISALMGGLIVAAWLLVRESMNHTVRTGGELESFTGQPVMGEVPRLPIRRRRDLLGYLQDNPTSPAVEAIRNLRTSLLLSTPGRSHQMIMLSSSVAGEGKTTLAISLAMNLAAMRKRVLLIEADIRRTTLSQYFGDAGSGFGKRLLSVLSGEMPLSQAVERENGVDILLGETTDISAADLLSSEEFRTLITEARKDYDHIIVDTPPVLLVPDARVLAPIADVLLFVVRWGSTPRGQVLSALRQFEAVGQTGIGLALTQVDVRKQKRYEYGAQYGGQYGGYGAYSKRY
jgi:capsular exopolysaccharide synthesis family protein